MHNYFFTVTTIGQTSRKTIINFIKRFVAGNVQLWLAWLEQNAKKHIASLNVVKDSVEILLYPQATLKNVGNILCWACRPNFLIRWFHFRKLLSLTISMNSVKKIAIPWTAQLRLYFTRNVTRLRLLTYKISLRHLKGKKNRNSFSIILHSLSSCL